MGGEAAAGAALFSRSAHRRDCKAIWDEAEVARCRGPGRGPGGRWRLARRLGSAIVAAGLLGACG
ncbi:MAG: hypothetical protein ACYCUF_06395, partial [Acidimicrobiales bacterium]